MVAPDLHGRVSRRSSQVEPGPTPHEPEEETRDPWNPPPSNTNTRESLKCAELYHELERVEISLVQERGHSEQLEKTYRQKLEEQAKLHAQDVAALEEMICEVLKENERLASRVSALEVGVSLDGASQPLPTPCGGYIKSEATATGSGALPSSDLDCYASTCSIQSASDEPLHTPRMKVECGQLPKSHASWLRWKKDADLQAGAGSDTESDRTTAEMTSEVHVLGSSVNSDVPVLQCAK